MTRGLNLEGPDQERIGERLREARLAKGLTLNVVADHLGCTAQAVQQWEKNRTIPETNRLSILAGLLGVTVEWVLTGNGFTATVANPSVDCSSGSTRAQTRCGCPADSGTNVLTPVTHLGRSSALPESPEAATLDRVANPHPDTHYVARFTAPEFTSLCPVTGQPDFAHLVIDYVPQHWLVESKSLKLYLAAFRNHGAFHEDCTVAIGKRLAALLEPHFLRIGGYWYPRGGMPIDVFWQTGTCPKGVWLPDQGVAPYRGRG